MQMQQLFNGSCSSISSSALDLHLVQPVLQPRVAIRKGLSLSGTLGKASAEPFTAAQVNLGCDCSLEQCRSCHKRLVLAVKAGGSPCRRRHCSSPASSSIAVCNAECFLAWLHPLWLHKLVYCQDSCQDKALAALCFCCSITWLQPKVLPTCRCCCLSKVRCCG